jgi:hypothetical protein
MPARWFTPASARAALEELRSAAEAMTRLSRELEALRPRTIRSDQPVGSRYFELAGRLARIEQRIGERGVRVGDPCAGILDFPARRDGHVVFLCWRVGEEALAFWHEPGNGIASRRVVDEDGPWESG